MVFVFAVVAILVAISLVTGKTLGPRGTSPIIADRRTERERYWFATFMHLGILAFFGWMAWQQTFGH